MFWWIVISILLSGCQDSGRSGLPEPTSMIASPTNGFPGVVQIRGKKLCTGVVIGPRTVLTAAHCTLGGAAQSVQAGMELYNVVDVSAMGPGNPADQNDVAFLYLAQPFSRGDSIVRVGAFAQAGDLVTLVGFGCNALEAPHTMGVKRAGTNVLTEAGTYLESVTPMFNSRIQGPSNRAASCAGDSGGPMLNMQGEVVGISHTSIEDGSELVSRYINITRPDMRALIQRFVR